MYVVCVNGPECYSVSTFIHVTVSKYNHTVALLTTAGQVIEVNYGKVKL